MELINNQGESYNDIMSLLSLRDDYNNAKTITEEFNIIRSVYNIYSPLIKSGNNITIKLLNWRFSPIEIEAYNHIRCLRGLNVYPQYPVDKFFIDFACPVRKIAIELDGKEFHDRSKDRKRDEKLDSLGWKVFRIEGFRCFSSLYFDFDNPYEYAEVDSNNKKWFSESLEGILTAISITYFGESGYYGYEEFASSVCSIYQSNPLNKLEYV